MRKYLIVLAVLMSYIKLFGTDVKQLIEWEAIGEGAIPHLAECQEALISEDPLVRLAAMRVFISANVKYPSIVSELLEIIAKPGAGSINDVYFGTAAVALTVVCDDEKMFLELLRSQDKRIRMTLSSALYGSSSLTPLLEQNLDYPEPEISAQNNSILLNGDFESLDNWEFSLKEGATGACAIDEATAYSGNTSLRLTKDSGEGYLELRSRQLIEVPPHAVWTWRGFYHADHCRGSSLLLFRLEDEQGQVKSYDSVPSPGWGWESQSYLVNYAPDEWAKRLLILPSAKEARKFRLVVQVYGNPVTVWLDHLRFPASEWHFYGTPRLPSVPAYTLEQAMKILAKRETAEARIEKNSNGIPELKVNGRRTPPVFYFPWNASFGDFRVMEQAGIHIHNVVLKINDHGGTKTGLPGVPVWPTAANDEYNFTSLINEVKSYIRKTPQGFLILGFHLCWPNDYVKYNPETKWMDQHGNVAFGSATEMKGFKPEKQIPEDCVMLPSPYHDKLLEDGAKILKCFVTELKKEGLDKIVIGCFVSGGHDGQFEVLQRDHSPNGKRAWRKWLTKKYQTDAAIRTAWNRDGIHLKDVQVPPNTYEVYDKANDSPLFYSKQKEQADRDYELYRQQRIWETKEYLLNAVKEEFDKPVIGISWLMGGLLAKYSEPFLKSEVIDIVVTQPTYQHRRPGMPWGSLIPFETLHAHNKISLLEADTRSWLRETYTNELGSMKIGTPMSLKEFQSLNRKLAGEQLANGQGWWYYDISENAYSHPGIMSEIHKSVESAEKVINSFRKFKPDVAVVYNSSATYIMRANIYRFRSTLTWLLGYQGYALAMSGVPYDCYSFDDLMKSPDGDQYKIYLFLTAFELTAAEREYIEQKLKHNNKVLVWHYAPGYMNGDSPKDTLSVSALTGIQTEISLEPQDYHVIADISTAHPLTKNLLPLQGPGEVFRLNFGMSGVGNALKVPRLTINDPKAIVLGRYRDGAAALAVKTFADWTSVYVTANAGINAEFLNNLAEQYEAYRLCAPSLVHTSMNGSFVTATALGNSTVEFTLPENCNVVDMFTDKPEKVRDGVFSVEMTTGESRWWYLSR